jgi:uncharacterized protein (UPF0276 family)
MTKTSTIKQTRLPARAGVGLKGEHYQDICEASPDLGWPDIGWFEVHPENYMGAGGAPHHYLTKIRENYPLSLHGVGLSIGGSLPPSQEHLSRVKELVERYQPESFSEHLAWSSHEAGFFNDLLPLPLTEETCQTVSEHIDHIQETIGQKLLLENPSTYVAFERQDFTEIEFLKEVVKRSGCGLLLDVNNVYVSCTNHERSSEDYIKNFPMEAVGEIHLGGHAPDEDDLGNPLLIDAHDRKVVEDVWALYDQAISQKGPVATLIEWDNDVPTWDVLFSEAKLAEEILQKYEGQTPSKNAAHKETAEKEPILKEQVA